MGLGELSRKAKASHMPASTWTGVAPAQIGPLPMTNAQLRVGKPMAALLPRHKHGKKAAGHQQTQSPTQYADVVAGAKCCAVPVVPQSAAASAMAADVINVCFVGK